MPAAAAAALLVVNGGLMMRTPAPMIAKASGARVSPTIAVEMQVRGPGEPLGTTTVRRNEVLNFQIPPSYSDIEVRMTDRSGKTVLQWKSSGADMDRGGLSIVVDTLSPGMYQLVVTGTNREDEIKELDRRQVEVKQ
jgi:hypothetical protein